MTNPCKDCRRRTVGCGVGCSDYALFRAECDAKRNQINDETNVNEYFNEKLHKSLHAKFVYRRK